MTADTTEYFHIVQGLATRFEHITQDTDQYDRKVDCNRISIVHGENRVEIDIDLLGAILADIEQEGEFRTDGPSLKRISVKIASFFRRSN